MIFGNQELLLKKVETISKLHQSVLVENEEKLEEASPNFFDPNSPTQRVGGDIT